MKTFRAFVMDANGRFIGAHVLDDVESDDQAITAALPLTEKNAIEIWQGDRRIAELARGGEVRHFRIAPPQRPEA